MSTDAPRRTKIVVLVLVLAACSAGGAGPRGPCRPDPSPGELGSICGFENPEDVEWVPAAGVLLVSQMRPLRGGRGGGALAALTIASVDGSGGAGEPAPAMPRRIWPTGDWAKDVGVGPNSPPVGDPACVTPPSADSFSPHGIHSAPSGTPGVVRVAVVGHRIREAVELFHLIGTGNNARLVWRGCALLPYDVTGNDVAIASDGEIIVSNFQPTMDGLRGFYYTIAGFLGRPTGDVLAWRPGAGWRHIAGTTAANPNGVALSPDEKSVYYAELSRGSVARVPRDGVAPGQSAERVDVIGNPDNLSWSSRGTLLIGSHTAGASMLWCLSGRSPCRTAWSIVEVEPRQGQGLKATELLHHDGSVVGAVASAAEANGRYYLGAVFDDRIGVWQPKQ